MPLVEIKYFNVLIDSKRLFDYPVKNKQEAYEKLAEMSRNDDLQQEIYQILCIIKNIKSLVYIYQDKYSIPQQINFAGKLEEDDGATMFFYF